MEKPVLVTGASGFVGSHVARQLVSEGRNVRAMIRTTSNREAIKDLSLEIVYGDALDRESLVKAMDGCSTVFHCIVDPRYHLTDTAVLYKNNVDGLRNSMDAALQCGIEKFVFISTMGTLGINPNGLVTEETQFNWHAKASDYVLSRVKGEELFFQYCREKGLPGVALNISMTYGPDDYQPTPQNRILRDVAAGKLRVTLNAASPSVDIRDAAKAAVLAETRGRIGERYIITNKRISFKELFTIATKYRNLKPPVVIPYSVAYFFAWINQTVLTLLKRRDFLVSTDAIFMADVFKEMDTTKAERELGWKPRPIEETVHDALDWFAAREAR